MTAQNLQVLTERMGLAFSAVILAVMPVVAVLLCVESI